MVEERESGGLDALYKEIMLEHHQEPRNFGKLEGADVEVEGYNPLCGDRVWIRLKRQGPVLEKCRFEGEGCSICMASASMMTEEAQGKTLVATEKLISDFRAFMQGALPLDHFGESDLSALGGVSKFPVRIKCALLPWTTLKDALEKLKEKEQRS